MGAWNWMSGVLLGAVLIGGAACPDFAHAQKPSVELRAKTHAKNQKKSLKSKVSSAKSNKKLSVASAKLKKARRNPQKKAGRVVAGAASRSPAARKGKLAARAGARGSQQAEAASATRALVRKSLGRPGVSAGSRQPAQAAALRQASRKPGRATAVAPQQKTRPAVAGVAARKVSVAAGEQVRQQLKAPAGRVPALMHGSLGEAIGLNRIPDPLALRSSVALVVDPRNGRILYDKNSSAVLPIASLTKLMTAMVVLDGGQSLEEKIRIESADRDLERFSSSRLPVGSELTRAELLQLALMSSENRAASALARSYPGGLRAFVDAANRKAREIGMWDSVFMDGTGLSSANVSTARDLAVLVARASRYPAIRRYSVASALDVRTAHGVRTFRTTNPMVVNSRWGLTLQKTGFINEAGNCLVMQARVDGRQLIIVLLDSQGRYSRVSDANRLRRFIEG